MSGWSTSYNRGKIFDPQKACVRLCKSQTIGLDFFHQGCTFNLHELTTIIVTTLSAAVHDDPNIEPILRSNINNMSAKKRRRDTRPPQASRPADSESFTDFKCLVCLQLLIEPVCSLIILLGPPSPRRLPVILPRFLTLSDTIRHFRKLCSCRKMVGSLPLVASCSYLKI